MTKTEWFRNCSKCNEIIYYAAKKGMLNSNKKNTPCAKCRKKRPRTKVITNTEWFRICPICKETKYYSSKRNWKRAIETKSHCPECHPGPDKKTIEKIKKTLRSMTYPNRKSNKKEGKLLKYSRICLGCNEELKYVSEYSRDRAERGKDVCNSCSNTIYKKSWIYIIKDKHIKKMAASKAGYESFATYMKDLDRKKRYYREVRQITRLQDITGLENYDKLRGLCGVKGAYQLDHIISLDEGFKKHILAKDIGNISNLRIIPWQENLAKSNTTL